MAFRAVHEDRDGGENIADRKFAAGEDRAGRKGELRLATLTLEDFARLELIDGYAAAFRAERLPAIVGKANGLEVVVSLIVRKAQHLGQTKRPGL